jgi:hypothetical protein
VRKGERRTAALETLAETRKALLEDLGKVLGCELPIEKLVDRRVHGFVERPSGVADELHIRLRLEHLYQLFEVVLVVELDKVLGPPGRDDVYLSHCASFTPVSASAAIR